MQPDIDESAEVCDICDRGGRRSGRRRPSLAAKQRQPALRESGSNIDACISAGHGQANTPASGNITTMIRIGRINLGLSTIALRAKSMASRYRPNRAALDVRLTTEDLSELDRGSCAHFEAAAPRGLISFSTWIIDGLTAMMARSWTRRGLECRTKKPLIRKPPDQGPTQTTQLRQCADSRRGTNDGQLCQNGMLKIYTKCYENHHPSELSQSPISGRPQIGPAYSTKKSP
jgi:hypothetical protein